MKAIQTRYYLIPELLQQVIDNVADEMKQNIKGFSMDCLMACITLVAYNIGVDAAPRSIGIATIKKLIAQGDRYFHELIKQGIVIRSGSYEPKVKSYEYSFSEEYLSKYKSIPVTNMKLSRRLEKCKVIFEKQSKKSIRGTGSQAQFIMDITLVDGWQEILATKFKDDTNKYNSNFASAIRIVNKDFFWKRDGTSNRFHSNITILSKVLRPFLRVDGEPLIGLDVKNCQPYLSTIILTNPCKVSGFAKDPALVELLQSIKVPMKEDVSKYISLVTKGQIYEYMMEEFKKEGIILTRSETKKQMLIVLFAPNGYTQNKTDRKCREVFMKNFPTVHRVFSKVRGSKREGDHFYSYKRFPILLQRIESYLMLDVILKRVYSELPGIVAITIHDSILTGIRSKTIQAVLRIMTKEMEKFIGVKPKIKWEGELKVEEGVKGYVYI